jgi:hypothetical protein
VPKIASNSRPLFGSYSVDEATRTVTTNLISSTFSNGQGVSVTRLTAEEFKNTSPAGGRGSAFKLYKRLP